MKIKITGRELKKVLPYFNKIYTDSYKKNNGIIIEDFYGKLKFSSGNDEASISILIDAEYKDFLSKIYVSFDNMKRMLSKIKISDEIVFHIEEKIKVSIREQFVGEFDYIKEPDLNAINKVFLLIEGLDIDRTNLLDLLTGVKYIKPIESDNELNNIFLNVNDNKIDLLNLNPRYSIFNTSIIDNKDSLDFKVAINLNIIKKLFEWVSYLKEDEIKISLSDNILNIFTKNRFFNIKISNVENDNVDKYISNINHIHSKIYGDNEEMELADFIEEFAYSNVDNDENTISTKLTNWNYEAIKLDLYLYKNLIEKFRDDVKVSMSTKSKFRPLIFKESIDDTKVNIILNRIFD